jgi:hypothetical protein
MMIHLWVFSGTGVQTLALIFTHNTDTQLDSAPVSAVILHSSLTFLQVLILITFTKYKNI